MRDSNDAELAGQYEDFLCQYFRDAVCAARSVVDSLEDEWHVVVKA